MGIDSISGLDGVGGEKIIPTDGYTAKGDIVLIDRAIPPSDVKVYELTAKGRRNFESSVRLGRLEEGRDLRLVRTIHYVCENAQPPISGGRMEDNANYGVEGSGQTATPSKPILEYHRCPLPNPKHNI